MNLYNDHYCVVARPQVEAIEVVYRLVTVHPCYVGLDRGHVAADVNVSTRRAVKRRLVRRYVRSVERVHGDRTLRHVRAVTAAAAAQHCSATWLLHHKHAGRRVALAGHEQ